MSLKQQEQEELAELVEEQSDIIKEMAITQNALLSLLLEKGYIESEELEETRTEMARRISEI